MTLPNDPEKQREFFMLFGSSRTLISVYDLITEVQTFHLDGVWPVDSNEYKAVANTLEALKRMVATKQNRMEEKAVSLLDES